MGVVVLPIIVVSRILSYPEYSAVVQLYIGHIYNPVTPFVSDNVETTIPPKSFCIIKQAIEQPYHNFQADLLPDRSSSAQAQDSPSTQSSTPPLIPTPREEINENYNVPYDLTLDIERFTMRDLPGICQLP